MARRTFPVTIVYAVRVDPATGEALESQACPGLEVTPAELRAAWSAPSTEEIVCGTCGSDQDWCPDLREILGTYPGSAEVRHRDGLVLFR